MILHLLRLMWKAKKRNALLAFQLFVGFLLIFVLVALSTHNLKKYLHPLGFQYKNLWYLETSLSQKEKVAQFQTQLKSLRIAVSSASRGVAPYSPALGSSSADNYMGMGKRITWENLDVDLAYKDVMGLEMAEGRWFDESDKSVANQLEVISPALREAAYRTNDSIKPLASKHIGVLKNFCRLGEFEGETISAIRFLPEIPEWLSGYFLLRVPEGSGIELQEKLVGIARSLGSEQTKITRVEDQRAAYLKKKLAPLLITASVGLFLFINVILGLFGVLWYSISQRMSEIGVRRAVGATAANISMQFVAEMLILAGMGTVPGIIVAIQIQMLNLLKTDWQVCLLSMAITTILIGALVSVCALIPGLRSVRMNPADALADE